MVEGVCAESLNVRGDADTGSGNTGNNVIDASQLAAGTVGSYTASGEGGDDTLFGNADDDRLEGRAGDNALSGRGNPCSPRVCRFRAEHGGRSTQIRTRLPAPSRPYGGGGEYMANVCETILPLSTTKVSVPRGISLPTLHVM